MAHERNLDETRHGALFASFAPLLDSCAPFFAPFSASCFTPIATAKLYRDA